MAAQPKIIRRKPPYPFCWECSQELHGNRHVVLETPGGTVYVHPDCGVEMLDAGEAVVPTN